MIRQLPLLLLLAAPLAAQTPVGICSIPAAAPAAADQLLVCSAGASNSRLVTLSDIPVELLATACADGQVVKASSGALVCAADEGGGGAVTAADVALVDVGALYVATDVEAALAETPPGARTPTAHAASHADAGGDELSVAGLSGVLADPQTPAAHAASHLQAAGDAIAADALGTGCADGSVLSASAGGLICAATAPPSAHAASHGNGGGDELAVESLGTSCADGEIVKAQTGGLICGSAGSASFTTVDTDYGPETVTSAWEFSGSLRVPIVSALVTADCDAAGEAGRVVVLDTAATGQQWYACEGVAGWVQQGGSGSAQATGVALRRTATDTLTASTFLSIPWDTEEYDDAAMWSAGSPSTITIPSDGVYTATCSAGFAGAVGGVRIVRWYRNLGTGTEEQLPGTAASIGNADAMRTQATFTLRLSAADTLTCRIWQNSGGNLNTVVSEWATSATVHRIGD